LRRGIDLSGLRARAVDMGDFFVFDYVLAMDRDNYADLSVLCPEGQEHKLRMFLDFADGLNDADVPDPYYGGAGGFERVMDMVDQAARGLLDEIRATHELP
jgi:protein-tyrosine phosphatase